MLPGGTDQAFVRESLYGTAHEATYSGALSFMRRKYTRDLTGVDIAVTGVPFDTATTNRPGTRFGPAAVRAASTQLAWGVPWPWDFDPLDRLAMVDYGDCSFDFGTPAGVPEQIEAHATQVFEQDVSLLTIGGDHYITLPLLRAAVKKYGKLALVHFDAHSDTWSDEGNRIDHGTMFWHAVREGLIDTEHSVQIGIRTFNSDPMGITWLDAGWVHQNGPDAAITRALRIVGDKRAYLTFDIDCLDPSFAPGTGTPVCGGLSTHQAQSIIRGLGDIDFVGMDMVEVAPAYDVGEVTALAAGSIIQDYLCTRAKDLPSRV